MQLIEDVLGSKNKIKLIRFLMKHKNWEFNITELSKDLGMNKGNISKLIRELERDNILIVNKKGKILLFKLNMDSRFVKNILEDLFNEEDSFFDLYLNKIVTICKRDKNIVSVILYGSVASNKAKLRSDIDILIITRNEKRGDIKEEIDKFLDEIIVNVDIMNLREFKKSYNEREPLIRNILDNHKILYGKKILEMV